MATNEPIQPVTTADEPVTTADVRATLSQIENLICDWRRRFPDDGSDPEPGVAREAARVAGIVEATVRPLLHKAACDTRAISERTTGGSPIGPCLRVLHTR